MMRYSVCIALIIGILHSACEDVVEIDTPSEPPRLTIDALIRITDTTTATQRVQIRAGLTSSFFGETSSAELQEISIQNLEYVPLSPLDSNFLILTSMGSGIYEGTKSTRFFTQGPLVLSVAYEGQRYVAETEFVPAPPISSLTQGDADLFDGDETEVILAFDDTPEEDNFYLFDFDFNEYLVTEDEFYQGQRFEFSYFYDDGLEVGMEVDIAILGVDQGFYVYMDQLIEQADGGSQGPFQTPAATVRGNIINVTAIDNDNVFDNVGDTDNFALGYFAVSQSNTAQLTVEER